VDKFILILFALIVFTGCSSHNQILSDKQKLSQEDMSASKQISNFRDVKTTNVAPALVLPPVYQQISPFGDETMTFSSNKTDFTQLLYTISRTAGLNLIIDSNVDKNIPITLSVKETSIEDILKIVMDLSGCYYNIEGNILHVKQYMQKSFEIPYVHSTTSFQTKIGGDMLGTTQAQNSDNVLDGKFGLKYDNPTKTNDYYKQIETNVKDLISDNGKYTLNKFSGILTVYDRKRNIDAIESFIKLVKKRSHAQVLIEAKLLEVVLNKGHSLGVDWTSVSDSLFKNGDKLSLLQTLGLQGAVAGSISYTTDNFSAIITALDNSGDVDTISNPRIEVLSGQSALISSGKLVPFWEKKVDTNQGTGGSASNTQVTYERRDVLNGVTMGVTPTITKDGRIMLNIVPITSRIEDVIVHYDEKGNSVASAPILNIKEAGTVIFAKDNDLVLIGGLISNSVKKTTESIPLLGDIPYLGNLFKKTITKNEKRELVILLKLNVIK